MPRSHPSRASALSRLAERPSPEALAAARRGLGDADPLVRQAAIQLFTSVPARERLPVAALLADPVRLVRMEAASVLAAVPATALSEAQRAAFDAPPRNTRTASASMPTGRNIA